MLEKIKNLSRIEWVIISVVFVVIIGVLVNAIVLKKFGKRLSSNESLDVEQAGQFSSASADSAPDSDLSELKTQVAELGKKFELHLATFGFKNIGKDKKLEIPDAGMTLPEIVEEEVEEEKVMADQAAPKLASSVAADTTENKKPEPAKVEKEKPAEKAEKKLPPVKAVKAKKEKKEQPPCPETIGYCPDSDSELVKCLWDEVDKVYIKAVLGGDGYYHYSWHGQKYKYKK